MAETQTTPDSTENIAVIESKDLACSFPKIFTTHPKSKRRPNKKSLPKSKDSIANSMLFSKDLHERLKGLFEGEMAHLSFDIKKPLREELNLVAKEKGTSICKILNELALAYIIAHHTSKHALSNTLPKISESPVVIEALNFTQNVQSRPRRLMRAPGGQEEKQVNNSEVAESNFCEIRACEGKMVPAVATGVCLKDGKPYRLCLVHGKAYSELKEWRLIDE